MGSGSPTSTTQLNSVVLRLFSEMCSDHRIGICICLLRSETKVWATELAAATRNLAALAAPLSEVVCTSLIRHRNYLGLPKSSLMKTIMISRSSK